MRISLCCAFCPKTDILTVKAVYKGPSPAVVLKTGEILGSVQLYPRQTVKDLKFFSFSQRQRELELIFVEKIFPDTPPPSPDVPSACSRVLL